MKILFKSLLIKNAKLVRKGVFSLFNMSVEIQFLSPSLLGQPQDALLLSLPQDAAISTWGKMINSLLFSTTDCSIDCAFLLSNKGCSIHQSSQQHLHLSYWIVFFLGTEFQNNCNYLKPIR